MENTWQWKLRAETIPGWLYSVEESQDLITWTTRPNSYFYGNGQRMSHYFCDGPPPVDTASGSGGSGTGSVGPSHVLKLLFLTLRMQANGASSRYYLQREAAPAANIAGWDADLTDLLPPQPMGMRQLYLMGWTDPNGTNTYWVDVQVIVEDAPPPLADPAASAEEAADLHVFQQIKSQIIARLLLPQEEAPGPTPSDSKFARIRRTAIDSNGNGYPDWYEIANFPPGAQFAQAGSSIYVIGSMDSDDDGFTDAEEAAAGTDPNDKTKHPPAVTRLVVLRRSATFSSKGGGGKWTNFVGWPDLQNYTARLDQLEKSNNLELTPFEGLITPLILEGHVTAIRPFSASPHADAYLRSPMSAWTATGSYTQDRPSDDASTSTGTSGSVSSTNAPSTGPTTVVRSGGLEQLAVWVEHKPKEATPITVNFVIAKRSRSATGTNALGDWSAATFETKMLTVAANNTLSSENCELLPAFPVPTGDTFALGTEVSLLPVQVVGRNNLSLPFPKVAKLSEPDALPRSSPPNLHLDADHFRLRILGGAIFQKASVRLATTGNPEPAYNDDATEIGLLPEQADLISAEMVLVSDISDDTPPIGGANDNQKNDRTHLIQLGGRVQLTSLKMEEQAEQQFDMNLSTKVQKTVKVRLVNCEYGPPFFSDPCWNPAQISLLKKTMKERYAQVGIDFEFTEAVGLRIGFSGNLNSNEVPELSGIGPMVIPQTTKDIINANAGAADEVVIYLVKSIDSNAGLAIMPNYISAVDKAAGYGNKMILGDAKIFTASHELEHVLLDARHEDYPDETKDEHMLWMSPTSQTNGIGATKRISPKQAEQILKNALAK